MRARFLVLSAVLVGVAAGSSPIPEQNPQPSPKRQRIAIFPPLGIVSHNVDQDPTGTAHQRAPEYDDIIVAPNPAAQQVLDVKKREYVGSMYEDDPAFDTPAIPATTVSAITKKLTSVDFVPFARTEYFSWYNRHNLAVTGWLGRIQSIRRTPRGLLVQVRIQPRLVQAGAFATVTFDSYTETYLFDTKMSFQLIEGQPGNKDYQGSLLNL